MATRFARARRASRQAGAPRTGQVSPTPADSAHASAQVPVDASLTLSVREHSAPESRRRQVLQLQRLAGNHALTAVLQPVASSTQVQRFAPPGHEVAGAAGLRDSFSSGEIGELYAANWERDLSQAIPQVGDVMIAWKALKESAKQGPPSAEAAAMFQLAVIALIRVPFYAALGESMGGYQSWEHMDNPGEGAAKKANQRWYGSDAAPSGALAGYILDSRAYIKDEIVAAVDSYRTKLGGKALASRFDNWTMQGRHVARPSGYGRPKKVPTPILPRTPIAEAAADEASQLGARPGSASPAFKMAADHLGRASHATEDFFAHGNWIELATAQVQGNKQAASAQLFTGTFEIADKIQALGHKVRSMAEALLRDHELVLAAYERRDEDIHAQPNPITPQSTTLRGEAVDIVSAAGEIESRVLKANPPKARMEDYVASRPFLEELRAKGEEMMAHGTREAPETGHGRIAKDAPEEGKDYAGAIEAAAAADRLIFGPLRAAMDNPDDTAVTAALSGQLALVDEIIAAPGPSHPIVPIVKDHLRPRGDFPIPDSGSRPA